jgi:hypothetical protein
MTTTGGKIVKRAVIARNAVVGWICGSVMLSCTGAVAPLDPSEQVAESREALIADCGKVLICHLPGGDLKKAEEISVAPSAVDAHLRHGDSRGHCSACSGRPDGTACDDGNACTQGDQCHGGGCAAGTPMVCATGDACAPQGTCDPSSGACVYALAPDGTPCDDQNLCTLGETCLAGSCQGGAVVPGVVDDGTTTTVTCPPTATAVDGIVQTTCTFPGFFAPNNVFSGQVQLISHLTRDFGSFDILPIDATTVQLACVYETADGEQIGGIYRILPVAADHCTATADSFTCAD